MKLRRTVVVLLALMLVAMHAHAEVNVASDKVVEADATLTTNVASLAVDGNTNTCWNGGSAATHWLRVDLGAIYSLLHVDLYDTGAGGVTYNLYYSTNNQTWADAGGDNTHWTSITNGALSDSNPHDIINFNGQGARYLKYEATGVVDWVALQEIEAWSCESDYTCTTNSGEITITGYTGTGGVVNIPGTITGLPVTGIADHTFDYCSTLASLKIPVSVTNIGSRAFTACTNLTSITVAASNPVYSSSGGILFNTNKTILVASPGASGSYTVTNSVKSIGAYSFAGCDGLTNVVIGSNVTTLGDYVFDGCASLRNITIQGNITNMGVGSFANCGWLTNAIIGSNVTTIGDYAFSGCTHLPGIIIPDSVTNIGVYAFDNCDGLTNVIIGSGIAILNDFAFNSCTNLPDITIPGNVLAIGSGTFDFCYGLTNVSIGSGVTNIGDFAFSSCNKLTNITVSAANSFYSSLSGALFNKNQTALIQVPPGKAGVYAIPSSVTSIGVNSFFGCRKLTTVLIPASVGSIGDSAFNFCTGLTNLTIPASVTNIADYAFVSCTNVTGFFFRGNVPAIGTNVFNSDNMATVYYPDWSTGWPSPFGSRPTATWAAPPYFYTILGGAINITMYKGTGTVANIPGMLDGLFVTGIGDHSFRSNSLIAVVIPDSVVNIGSNAFAYCTNLTSIIIPAGVTNIGDTAFVNCTSLTGITVNAGNPVFSSIGGVLFDNNRTTLLQCPQGLSGSYSIPSGVTRINSNSFYGCSGLTNVIVPGSVTNIGDEAFGNCTNIAAIYFAGNAPVVGFYAVASAGRAYIYYLNGTAGWGHSFDTRPALAWNTDPYRVLAAGGSITITGYTGTNGVETIPDTIATLPITSIESNAFTWCDNLTSVTLPNSITNIGNQAFMSCLKLANVVIPDNVTRIGSEAFRDCISMTEISVGTSNSAYSSLDGVLFNKNRTELIIYPAGKTNSSYVVPAGVTNVWEYAFSSCWDLSRVSIPDSVISIGRRTFDLCNNLNAITVDAANPVYASSDGVLYNKSLTTLFLCPILRFSYNAPASLTSVADLAFYGCIYLTNVTLSAGIADIGDSAFGNCMSLSCLYFRGNAPVIGTNVLDTATNSTVYYVSSTSGWGPTFGGRPTALWGGEMLSVTPLSLDFGTVEVGHSVTRTFTVQNIGGGTLSGSADVMLPFSILSGSNYNLTAGQSQVVTVCYSPTYSATNTANVSFTGGGDATRPVTGVAIDLLESISVTPAEMNFGTVELGHSVTMAFTVQNAGAGILSGNVSASPPFSILSGSNYNLAAGQSQVVEISYTPTSVGFDHAFVMFNGADSAWRYVYGTARAYSTNVMPAWATGTFNGYVEDGGVATMTVTAKGLTTKVTGKITCGASNYTFTASYLAGGNPLDGYSIVTTAKVGKAGLPLRLLVEHHEIIGNNSGKLGVVTGTLGSDKNMAMYRNVWQDYDMMRVPAMVAGYYTATMPGDGTFGSGYLALTVDTKGNVKATGKMGDGTAVSLSSTLLVDGPETNLFFVIYSAPAVYKGGRLAGLASVGFNKVLSVVDGTTFSWVNHNPQATGVYTNGGFARDLDLAGGWYDKVGNLASYYTNKVLTVGTGDAAVPEITVGTESHESVCWNPDGLPLSLVTSGGVLKGIAAPKSGTPVKVDGAWSYDATNSVGLTFGLTRATGVYKGSFKAWFDYGTVHTSKKIAFEGILTPERADKTDGVEGRGFYLWSEKATTPVTYTYKSSYDFVIQSGP